MTYQILLFVHVLCFVYWLGGDLGVFYSSRFVVARDQPAPARAVALKVMVFLDLIPRICLVLMLPIGWSLVHVLFGVLTDSQLLVLWAASLMWLVLTVTLYRAEGAPWTQIAGRIDLMIRAAVVGVMVWLAIQTFSSDGLLPQAPWLGVKLLAFATCVACGIIIRLVLRPFGPALAAVMSGNPGSEDQATIERCLGLARPFVVLIWLALLVAAWAGLNKAFF